jgi:hypothetical protein
MAIRKLPGSRKRLFVAIGFDRFERLYPVFLINQICAIRRHDCPPQGQHPGMELSQHGAMREPVEPESATYGTQRKPLAGKNIITVSNGRWLVKIEDLREQAERCRRLAKQADPFTAKRLMDLAGEYEVRMIEVEKGYRPSAASRNLKGEP